MNDHQDRNQNDLLQQAVRALRQTAVPDGPSPKAVTELVATLEKAAPQPITFTLKKRMFTMKPITKIAVAATILLALGSFFAWTLSSDVFTSIALAQVADALEKVRNATYESKITINSTISGESTRIFKTMFLAPSRSRVETPENSIMIFDNSAGKALTLEPKQKRACVIELDGRTNVDRGFEDVLADIRQAIAGTREDCQRLADKEIDGRRAVGFRIQKNMVDTTIWADPETALPIRIETNSTMLNSHSVMSNFQFNVELDPLLFSLEPPADYTVKTMKVDASKFVEKDLIQLLGFYGEHKDGVFPSSLKPEGIIQRVMTRHFEEFKSKSDRESPEGMDALAKLMRGTAFIAGLKPENDWHYAGKDVKLGTPARPIFWYKPEGSKNYRAIYADLSVKEVAPNELKGFPEAADP